jgi:hypothetical protein
MIYTVVGILNGANLYPQMVRHKLEDSDLNNHCHENLESYYKTAC